MPAKIPVHEGVAGAVIQTYVIPIGDWNMDSTSSVNVAHGLSLGRIIGAECIIRNDADTARYPLAGIDNAGSGNVQGSIQSIDANNVVIMRVTGGAFDTASFDSISFNRGWVIIQYDEFGLL